MMTVKEAIKMLVANNVEVITANDSIGVVKGCVYSDEGKAMLLIELEETKVPTEKAIPVPAKVKKEVDNTENTENTNCF